MALYDSASFAAGQDTGTRMSACVARLTAIQLLENGRWWNKWRRRLIASALVACAEELESAADASVAIDASTGARAFGAGRPPAPLVASDSIA